MTLVTAAEVRARPIRDVNFEPAASGAGERTPSLIPLKPSGTTGPVFLIHGAYGQVFHFKRLAERVREDIPVYGLEARGLRDGGDPHLSVTEMAKSYIEEIRGVQPAGPYLIGGFSFGGQVAWEMAQQLDAAGEQVSLLTIDQGAPVEKKPMGRLRKLRRIAGFHWQNWRGLEGTARASYRREAFRDEWRRVLGFFRLNQAGFLHRLTLKVGRQPEQGQADVFRMSFAVREQWERTPYPHPITLFRAKIQRPGSNEHPALGLTPAWAPGGVDVRHVPGSHAFVFVAPHVNALTAEFEAWVDRELEAYGHEAAAVPRVDALVAD